VSFAVSASRSHQSVSLCDCVTWSTALCPVTTHDRYVHTTYSRLCFPPHCSLFSGYSRAALRVTYPFHMTTSEHYIGAALVRRVNDTWYYGTGPLKAREWKTQECNIRQIKEPTMERQTNVVYVLARNVFSKCLIEKSENDNTTLAYSSRLISVCITVLVSRPYDDESCSRILIMFYLKRALFRRLIQNAMLISACSVNCKDYIRFTVFSVVWTNFNRLTFVFRHVGLLLCVINSTFLNSQKRGLAVLCLFFIWFYFSE